MNSLKNLLIKYLFLGALLVTNCVAVVESKEVQEKRELEIVAASPETSIFVECEELQRLNFIKQQMSNWLESFYLIEKFLNIAEKKVLAQVKSFYDAEINKLAASLDPDLLKSFANLVCGFKSACLKIEVLAVHKMLDLQAQKIKLKILTDLFAVYKKSQGKKVLEYSNKLVYSIVLNALPDDFKCSLFKRIMLWFRTKSREASQIRSLIFQDYCAENIILADRYLDLITQFNNYYFGGKKLDFDAFVAQVHDLVQQLMKEQSENYSLNTVINLMIEKLIAVREQVVNFCQNVEGIGLQADKLKLMARFKVLLEDSNFKKCRADKRFATVIDLFVGRMQQLFGGNGMEPSDLINLFELEQKVSNLSESLRLGCLPRCFSKQSDELIVLNEIAEIISEVNNDIKNKISGQGSGSLVEDGLSLLKQLKNAGLKESLFTEVAGEFMHKKFTSLTEVVAYVGLKTSPIWLKTVLPMLPSKLGSTVSSVLAALKPEENENNALAVLANNPELVNAVVAMPKV